MVTIVTERGVPGTVGAVLVDPAGARYLLSCFHVLFGAGARQGGRVWALREGGDGRSYDEIGCTSRGELGRITTSDGGITFVDCAVALLHGAARSPLPAAVRRALDGCASVAGVAEPIVGRRVRKHGRVTGRTWGVITDTAHFERPFLCGRVREAPGQILIRPEHRDHCFSAAGESGAAVLDDDDRIVGFLWASNAHGEGIAYPAAAVLRHLNMALAGPA
jgi:hypothetical protein